MLYDTMAAIILKKPTDRCMSTSMSAVSGKLPLICTRLLPHCWFVNAHRKLSDRACGMHIRCHANTAQAHWYQMHLGQAVV